MVLSAGPRASAALPTKLKLAGAMLKRMEKTSENNGWCEQVRKFTAGHMGPELPNGPREMTPESAKFLVRMVFSEMSELLATLPGVDNAEQCAKIMHELVDTCGIHGKYDYSPGVKTIAAQADALVDAAYYMNDTAIRHGIDLDPIFRAVNDANLAKADDSGKFIKINGKVIKPPGWREPDVESIIQDQLNN